MEGDVNFPIISLAVSFTGTSASRPDALLVVAAFIRRAVPGGGGGGGELPLVFTGRVPVRVKVVTPSVRCGLFARNVQDRSTAAGLVVCLPER
jgi:hypothetical protein